jgi:two-component system response regulator TtrR
MAARQLQQPIVFLTGHADVPMAVTALRAKAFHFLEKPVKDRDLLAAVGQALAHDANERRGRQHAARARALVQSLTPREAEVARLVASGLRTEEIAHRLGLSARTIDMHRARLLQRLGARTSAEAARILQDGGGLAGA